VVNIALNLYVRFRVATRLPITLGTIKLMIKRIYRVVL